MTMRKRRILPWRRKTKPNEASAQKRRDRVSPTENSSFSLDGEPTIFFDCHQSKTEEFCVEDGDPRFTLTDWERASVIRLKRACEEEQTPYTSIFELAKYVLVARSCCKDSDPKADEKRMKNALGRIQKRRAFEHKYNMDEIDLDDALQVTLDAMPESVGSDYTVDKEGRVVVTHGPTDSKFIFQSKHNLACHLKQELHRMDLAAANLEEARNGIALVSRWGEGGLRVPLCVSFLRLFARAKEVIYPMHNHRIKAIYVQTSPLATTYVNLAKSFLPFTLQKRLVVVSTLKELHELVESTPGEEPPTAQQWFAERQKVYDLTLSQLKL